jgi:hypothetical protein
MRLRRLVVPACVLLLVACGNGARQAAGNATATTKRVTVPSSSDDGATTSSLVATATSAPPRTTSNGTAAPTSTSGTPATVPVVSQPTVLQASGLIHGTVERRCSTNTGSGGACYNQAGGIAGAAVEVRLPGGPTVGATNTDATGVFEFRVAPGRYVILETSSGVFQERDVAADRTTFVGLVLPQT